MESSLHGRGLFAVKAIKKHEIVAIKGGHIIDKKTLKAKKNIIGEASCQIADEFFLAPLTKEEYKDVMIFINHSCEPNVGLMGNIIFIAIENIRKNTELTIDYAFYKNENNYTFACLCKRKNCRKTVTGEDWKIKTLQKKYMPYFSAYLQRKIS
jgi:SET domain-containing protein